MKHISTGFFLLEQKASPFKTWSGFKGAIGTFPSILPFSGSPPPPPPSSSLSPKL